MKVKFKSKEAYNKFKNSSFEINRAFGELVDENTVFQVPTLSDRVLVKHVLVENQHLKDLDLVFFDYDDNSLFRCPIETDLLEEVSEDTEIQTENSFSIKFELEIKGSYTKEELLEISNKLKVMAEL
ncbi:hypothetical protein BI036_gp007 [Morganella phage vB_MmoM_MP1]|uniref:Uncharacterized protein n=1 Tax=Morganella phage vB_MmoM_MP1 TaxID=1852628 RepID=A0A192YBP4_9CAUD|nr:hypothetical protein BI036_gp007 [Morganella phage vB_MmoM_MP1]ANM46540.1 hypothetical protein MP1_gp0007 [Morganella phage vB_MmoM_MP1]